MATASKPVQFRWTTSRLLSLLKIQRPVIQGPFGGGLSSVRLAAEVSSAGGLGSFGLQGLTPARIREVIGEIRGATGGPFNVNLWVSTEDQGAAGITREAYEAAVDALRDWFVELKVQPPTYPFSPQPTFDEQLDAILESRPPVFSFVFGVPTAAQLGACRERGIVTIGTATSVEEAHVLEAAGVDAIVATGLEAGGHRVSFLREAAASLTGTLSLVPQVVDAVRVPVIAAGGIADARGVAAALALGAEGVQIGTAFLACDESGAPAVHRDAIFSASSAETTLTRAFTGRLARGMSNTLTRAFEGGERPVLPYPMQRELVSSLRAAAIKQGRTDLISLWAGQSAPLTKHRQAAVLYRELVQSIDQLVDAGLR